jgi:hypothetical protein
VITPANLGGYGDRVGQTTHRVLLSARHLGSDLTPLEESAAPDLVRLPGSIQRTLRQEYWSRLGDASWPEKEAANTWVAERTAELIDADLHIAYEPEEIERKAQNCAKVCFYIQDIEHAEEFCAARGVDPPPRTATSTRRGRLLRLRDHRWWRRQLDKLYGRRGEAVLRSAGHIQRARQLYASDLAVRARRLKTRIIDRWVKERVAVSDAGDQVELFEIRERSQANPALRRAELMTRIRGFEEVATAAGHVCEFWTLTAPSAFHRTNADGTPNHEWNGSTPREAQAWLCKMWARARSKIKRLSLLVYGFRIAEPHHDGTPHWHLVLFTVAHHRDTLRTLLAGIWLSEYQHERGAEQYRSRVIEIDPALGTAAGYIAKYVAKNIDGYQVGDDYEGIEGTGAEQTCERVTTWATRWGIRQFQQIGGPAVTLWRELRRIRDVCGVEGIEAARVHADAGDWAGFVGALGGIESGRAGSVGLWSELTGEINGYDELRGPQIRGVQSGVLQVETRTKNWRIEKRVSPLFSDLGPVTITVRGPAATGSPAAWTNPNESSMYGPH